MNHSEHNIVIVPFQPEDQPDAKTLVLAGLAEHWGTLDPTMNPDLNDIQASYSEGLFLVAKLEGKIIGTGAFIVRSDHSVEIVRMSVDTTLRRLGIGKKILEQLCAEAQARGYRQIILETTETWLEVIEFYKGFGFRITHYQDEDVYFAYDLVDAVHTE
ncbi:MAG: GNAT family N-acetyltransferase [Chloroflexota bacterium]